MTTRDGIDYREKLFEYKTLTKIRGEPTYPDIYNLENELKTNAQTVQNRQTPHGYLQKVIGDAKFALISDTPYVEPPLPPPLIIPHGTKQHETTRLQLEDQER